MKTEIVTENIEVIKNPMRKQLDHVAHYLTESMSLFELNYLHLFTFSSEYKHNIQQLLALERCNQEIQSQMLEEYFSVVGYKRSNHLDIQNSLVEI